MDLERKANNCTDSVLYGQYMNKNRFLKVDNLVFDDSHTLTTAF